MGDLVIATRRGLDLLTLDLTPGLDPSLVDQSGGFHGAQTGGRRSRTPTALPAPSNAASERQVFTMSAGTRRRGAPHVVCGRAARRSHLSLADLHGTSCATCNITCHVEDVNERLRARTICRCGNRMLTKKNQHDSWCSLSTCETWAG